MKNVFRLVALSIWLALIPMAEAQTEFGLDRDRFLSGPSPVHTSDGVDDLFMSGETVRSERPISGSAHLVGRRIVLDAAVGGDTYAAGMDVDLNAPVAGDVTVAGYDVAVANVGGDLRATAKRVSVTGPVEGYAIITSERASFDSQVKGDVSLTARRVDFGPNAIIEGQLIIYEQEVGATPIPESLISEDRIERRPLPGSLAAGEVVSVMDGRHPVTNFLRRVLVIGVIAGLLALFTPRIAARLQQTAFGKPLSMLLFGFLALSIAIGAAIVLIMTGYGWLLAPFPLLIGFLGAFVGYILGVYLLGMGSMSLVGRAEQGSLGNRALAALAGAFIATVVSRLPALGWIGTLTIALVGLGVLAVWIFRPKFFAAA